MLGILIGMPNSVLGKASKYPPILSRIWQYQRENILSVDSIEDNIYLKLNFNVERRNPTLKVIPSINVLADNEREYIRESYSKVLFTNEHHFDIQNQLLSSTIPGNRRAMPTLLNFLTPNLYQVTLYDNHILSPFNHYNRRYYRYSERVLADGTTRLDFIPKHFNTQLLNGYGIIETETGRIIRTVFNGEFDMITFRTEVQNGLHEHEGPLPARTNMAATFRFMGNRVSTLVSATYQNPSFLPDSIDLQDSRTLMDSIRPIPLSENDKRIYREYDIRHMNDTVPQDTTPKKKSFFKKVFLDAIGDNLVTPIAAETEKAYFRLSPIINPLQFSWSDRRGFRYKINLRSRYSFNAHRYLTFNPNFGYNFKFRQFYFTLPLRMTYNPKRNGYAEIIYGNGNRISNGSVADEINTQHGGTLDFEDTDIDKFNDNYLRAFNNIMVFDWLDIETGFIFHRRVALNKDIMRYYDMPTEYRSFAPMLGVKLRPWTGGPVFSIDWQRGMKGINGSTIDYESWEFDGSWKVTLPGMQVLNFRAGTGFYTRKAQNYFVDYANFRDNNLPEGWEDEWSGNFELLRSRVYNESDYYIRANVSYDSPMMIGTWVPYLGKFIERERFYLSTAIVANSKPYYELGYSFTNRYISIGMFAGFKNTHFQEIGFDFEFELFRRW